MAGSSNVKMSGCETFTILKYNTRNTSTRVCVEAMTVTTTYNIQPDLMFGTFDVIRVVLFLFYIANAVFKILSVLLHGHRRDSSGGGPPSN